MLCLRQESLMDGILEDAGLVFQGQGIIHEERLFQPGWRMKNVGGPTDRVGRVIFLHPQPLGLVRCVVGSQFIVSDRFSSNGRPMTTESTREALKFTRMCKYWGSRTCFNGMACPFAHSESELCKQPDLQATGLCYEFARSGHCRRGQACHFAHGKHELRSLPPRAKASVASAGPQTTKLDSVQGMVNQLRQLEEMVGRMMLELQIAAAPGHGGDHGYPSLPGSSASPNASSTRQRSESEPGRIWL
eukprot:s650_g2.t1